MVQDAATSEDPANPFLGSTAITGSDVSVIETTQAGVFALAEITGDLGSMVAVRISATQSSTGSLSLVAGISADLILKAE